MTSKPSNEAANANDQSVVVRGLCKRFLDGARELEVLRNVSFSVARGESMAITGPSGSGKSTLLNILAGLLPVDAGSVCMHVKASEGASTFRLEQMSESERTRLRRRYIGYVHQFYNLVPTLTVIENVRLPGRLNRGRTLDAFASELLTEFGLAERADVFPQVLSGGEQQRVAVARALLLTPNLLLADEPTGNLDAENAQSVATALFSAAKERGVSLVVATHSEAVAERAEQRLRL